MKALSFFSYKGGVGRTMALTNIARRLVEFGKSVMILDFDLEAPGVPFKMGGYINPDKIETGIVDYIYEFTKHGQLDDISKYVMELPRNNKGDAKMWFIPAGNSNLNEYWFKLSSINWGDMFYREGGSGLRFFLDLKEKIKKQYDPDFLLIDSRTGITELSGISLRILPDEVIMLFINNEENIRGTEKVLSFLNGNNDGIGNVHRIHLILTRIPQHKNPISVQEEYRLVERLKVRFSKETKDKKIEISTVHTDERLQLNEEIAFKQEGLTESAGIYSEHVKIFEIIFKEYFSDAFWQKQKDKTDAALLSRKAINLRDSKEKITLFTQAIKLDSDKWEYYLFRGSQYLNLFMTKEAIADMEKAVGINLENSYSLFSLAISYYMANMFDKALTAIEKSLEIDPNYIVAIDLYSAVLSKKGNDEKALKILNDGIIRLHTPAMLLNSRANLYRRMKKYNEAISDVSKAIQLQSLPQYYATLAEIKADQGDIEEFYLHLNTALSNGLSILDLRTARDIYERFSIEQRFKDLLRSYNINSEDVFHNGPLGSFIGVDVEKEQY